MVAVGRAATSCLGRAFRSIAFLLSVSGFLAVVPSYPAHAAVIDYSIVDLGALPSNFSPFFTPNVVNFSGQAVGSGGVAQAGGVVSSILHEVRAINDAGLAVGRQLVFDSGTGKDIPHAFVWSADSGIQTIGPANSEAWNINAQGLVVGDFLAGDGSRRGALWVPSSTGYDFFELSGTGPTRARGVSASGIVTGLTGSGTSVRAFTWDLNGDQQVHTIASPNATHGFAVNDSGQVSGRYSKGSDWQAFFWDPVLGFSDIGPSPSEGRAINNAGQAVGFFDPIGEGDRPIYHDLVGNEAVFETLGSLARALTINELGQVAGIALSGSDWHVVRWDPDGLDLGISEPPSLWLMGAAILLLVGVRNRAGATRLTHRAG